MAGTLDAGGLETNAGVALLRRIAPDGTVTTVLRFPDASMPTLDRTGTLVIDGARRLYFIDLDRCALHRVDLSKPLLETVASFPQTAVGCSIQAELRTDSDGNLYYVEGELGLGTLVMKKRSATGTVSTAFASPVDIKNFTVRPDGVVVFHDTTGVVYTAAPGGVPRRLSGTRRTDPDAGLVDGDADTARFSFSFALVADATNRVWTLEEGAVVRRLDSDGSVSTVAGRAPQDTLYRPGSGEQARLGSDSFAETRLVADGAGNAYFSGPALAFRAIARVTPEGVVSTVAGSPTERGTQDGRGTGARFEVLRAMARDPMGALLVADWHDSAACGRYGTTTRSVVRRVGADGNVSTLPYSFDGGISRLAPLAGDSMLVAGDRAVTNCTTEPKAAEVTAAGQETRVPALPSGPVAGDGLATPGSSPAVRSSSAPPTGA